MAQDMGFKPSFTKESVLGFATFVANQINQYASEQEGGKVDVFVAVGALAHVAYDLLFTVFGKTESDRVLLQGEMSKISDELFKKIDAIAVEHQTNGISNIMASAHVLTALAEIYSGTRDEQIAKIEQELAQQESASAENAGE